LWIDSALGDLRQHGVKRNHKTFVVWNYGEPVLGSRFTMINRFRSP
jgi:hypothetical protein